VVVDALVVRGRKAARGEGLIGSQLPAFGVLPFTYLDRMPEMKLDPTQTSMSSSTGPLVLSSAWMRSWAPTMF
jgi:hypothetical protein